MLLHYENLKNLFEAISNDLAESVKSPPDLSFMCEGGKMVHTHRSLLATFSPFLRSILASLASVQSSSSAVLLLPDASGAALEKVIQMITKPWAQEVFSLNSDEVEIIEILGIPVEMTKIMSSSNDTETEELIQEDVISNYNASETVTDENGGYRLKSSGKKTSKPAPNRPFAEGSPVTDQDCNFESMEPKCIHCDTMFRDTTPESIEEITIHLGEIHYESDLQVEQLKLFPLGEGNCGECAAEVIGDYLQKEHTLLEHPWQLLKEATAEIVANVFQDCTDPITEKLIEEATQSLLKHDFDRIENLTETQPTQRR
eukprot:GFUD01023981.1.p1 GENE.GFUD01023981.1~~GFUD01023981.1.p1  ORF type:complete len:315 (+),score=59.92 GFUD01023981.1:54-998(+)